jgi:hypothetical protein
LYDKILKSETVLNFMKKFGKSDAWLEQTSGAPLALIHQVWTDFDNTCRERIVDGFLDWDFTCVQSTGGNMCIAVKAYKGNRIEFFNLIID